MRRCHKKQGGRAGGREGGQQTSTASLTCSDGGNEAVLSAFNGVHNLRWLLHVLKWKITELQFPRTAILIVQSVNNSFLTYMHFSEAIYGNRVVTQKKNEFHFLQIRTGNCVIPHPVSENKLFLKLIWGNFKPKKTKHVTCSPLALMTCDHVSGEMFPVSNINPMSQLLTSRSF